MAEHFAFDPAGNLLYAAPAAGTVLKRCGDTEYAYDEQGRKIKRTQWREVNVPHYCQEESAEFFSAAEHLLIH